MKSWQVLAVAVLAAIAGASLFRRDGSKPEVAPTPYTPAMNVVGMPKSGANLIQRPIAGTVLADDGAFVSGATVRIASEYTMAGLSPDGKLITDDAGRFDFGPQPDAVYLIVAEMPGLTGEVRQVDLRDSNTQTDQLRLVLHKCQASIHGLVRDNAGTQIPNAVIALGENRLSVSGGIETDESGNYDVCVPPGGFGITVRADGYAAIWDYVRVFGRVRRDFILTPATSVMGRVVRASSYVAVEGAVVEFVLAEPRAERVSRFASTDSKGRFYMDDLLPGRHLVQVRGERVATKDSIPVMVAVGKSEEIVCEVVETFAIAGRIVSHTGMPVSGAVVSMVSAERDLTHPMEGVSRDDGTFVVDGAPPGEYRAFVRNSKNALPTVKVENADVRGVTIEVEEAGSISGRVMQAGKVVDGATVRANAVDTADGEVTRSDSDGRFVLRGLTTATYQLYSESPRLGAFTPGFSVALAKGEHRTGVVIELDQSGSISGVVVDQDDAPVAGAFVGFSLLRGSDFGQATTSDDGTFTATALLGGGEYLYEVRLRDNSPTTCPPHVGTRFPPVAVRDSKTHITGLRIKVRIERLGIRGRVTDVEGSPVAGVGVSAEPNDSVGYIAPRSMYATTDDRGMFRIQDLTAGRHTVRAITPRGSAHLQNVPAGATDVALQLVPLGGIDGRIDGLPSSSVVATHSDGLGRHQTMPTGVAFEFRNLPAGEYQVALSSGESARAHVSVPAGGVAKVRLYKREGGGIVGTVVDEKQNPVPGIRCSAALAMQHVVGPAITNANGTFQLDNAPPGPNVLLCHNDTMEAEGEVSVIVGQVARLDLIATTRKPLPRGYAGLTVENKLGTLIVSSVDSDGSAAAAGIVAGDVLLKIDDHTIAHWQYDKAVELIEMRLLVATVKLTLERNDKQLTLEMKSMP